MTTAFHSCPLSFAPSCPFSSSRVSPAYQNSAISIDAGVCSLVRSEAPRKGQVSHEASPCLPTYCHQRASLNGPGVDEETSPSPLHGVQLAATSLVACCSFIDCLRVTSRSGSPCTSRSTSFFLVALLSKRGHSESQHPGM